MKKLKWLLLLLAACCLVGCGKGDEATKTDKDVVEESKEDASKDDDKDVEKDKENKEDKKDDKGEEKEDPKPTLYSVTQTNKFEINGTWYDASGTWELTFDVTDGTDFPSIAEGVLTNGRVNAPLFLDENDRESDGVIYPCYFDGTQIGCKITFRQDGILLENHELLDEMVLFTREEGYGTAEKTTTGHAVTSDNVADIFGLWYDKNNEWNLLIFNNEYEDFPNIGAAVLTNGYQEYLLCLDEKGRKGEDTIVVCDENGTSYKAKMTFTEEGILLDSISALGTREMMFVRDGMYGSEPVGGNRYSARRGANYKVIQQVVGDGNTYYLLADWDTEEYVMAYVNYEDYTDYVDSFFRTETANVFYEQMLKGFPVVQLVSYEILSEEEFYNWYYGFGEEGEHDGDADVYTPVCNFPKTYDWSYYDEDTGLWVVANTTTNRRPFKMTGIEMLEWEDQYIRFIGRIKNEGSKPYIGIVRIYLCNEKGETIKTVTEGNAFHYLPDGYTTNRQGSGIIKEIEEAVFSNRAIPAGEEGIFGMMNGYNAVYVSDVTQPIHYIYIVLDEYWESYD